MHAIHRNARNRGLFSTMGLSTKDAREVVLLASRSSRDRYSVTAERGGGAGTGNESNGIGEQKETW